jgi:hypothetical protein
VNISAPLFASACQSPSAEVTPFDPDGTRSTSCIASFERYGAVPTSSAFSKPLKYGAGAGAAEALTASTVARIAPSMRIISRFTCIGNCS